MLDVSEINVKEQSNKPLGKYLVEAGLITPVQLERALDAQRSTRARLGEILASNGWLEQATIEYFMEKIILPERRNFQKNLPHPEKKSNRNLLSPGKARQRAANSSASLPAAELNDGSQSVSEIYLSARKIRRVLLFVVGALIIASTFVQLSQYFLPDFPLKDNLIRLFHVDREANIPSVLSALALLFCSILLATIARVKKLAGNRYFSHWTALSILFGLLSLDELVSIHEIADLPLRSAINTSGFIYFAWVIPGAIFVVACGLACLRLLATLPAKTLRLFLLAATLFLGGALGVEMVGGYVTQNWGQSNLLYATAATLEELLEMLGVVVFIYALLSYLKSQVKDVRLRVRFGD